MTIIELGLQYPQHFKATILGSDVLEGESVQYVVPRDTWFGSYPSLQDANALPPPPESAAADGLDSSVDGAPSPSSSSHSTYSFVGCTVAPGFEFSDFELASQRLLLEQFPLAADVISRLTRGLP